MATLEVPPDITGPTTPVDSHNEGLISLRQLFTPHLKERKSNPTNCNSLKWKSYGQSYPFYSGPFQIQENNNSIYVNEQFFFFFTFTVNIPPS